MNDVRPVYDCAVVGGGIAGLAVAEVFARSGRSVVLLERNARLCEEASSSHHGWFHFGSLYSMFPQNQFLRTMVGGVEDLLEYYSAFRGMNIEVAADGHLNFPQRPVSWFRDDPIQYLVASRRDPDFDMRSFSGVAEYAKKLFFLATWEIAVKQFISRHQRFHKHNWRGQVPASQWIPRAGWTDYSRKVITKPEDSDVAIDRDTHFRVMGFDRPMRAIAIVTDLARSLVGSGGKIMTGTEVERLENLVEATRVHTSAGSIDARSVVVASGKWLGHFLPRATDVKVVASPLLVVYPAVADTNFVRMTPFVKKSVNHLHHEVDGNRYSLIGGGDFADPTDPGAVARATERLVSTARRVFPKMRDAKVVETYLGFKTEIVAESGERNYQYFIREISPGVVAVVPGKFSLSFSLAVNTFKRMTGEEPQKDVRLTEAAAVQHLVKLPKHGEIVAEAMREQMAAAQAAQ